MRKNETRTGTLLSLAGILLLSFDTVLIRLAGVPAWEVSFWRGLLTAVTTSVILYARERIFFTEKIREEGFPLVASGTMWGITGILFVISVKMTVAANVLVMLSLSPLFAGIAGFIFMGERMRRETLAMFALSVAGVWIIFSGDVGEGTLSGNMLGLLVPVLLGINLAWMRKHREISRSAAIITGGIAAAVISLFFSSPFSIPLESVIYLALLGLAAIPLAQLLLSVGTKYLPASGVALIMMLETVLGPLWVWIFTGEIPPAGTFTGGSLIVAGVFANTVCGMFYGIRRR